MRRTRTALVLAPILGASCAGSPDRHTLAELRDVEPDVAEVRVEDSLDRVFLSHYHLGNFLLKARNLSRQ